MYTQWAQYELTPVLDQCTPPLPIPRRRSAIFSIVIRFHNALAALLAAIPSCSAPDEASPVRSPCEAASIAILQEPVAAQDLTVSMDLAASPHVERARSDLQSYLTQLWQVPVEVDSTPPAFTQPHVVWVSTSAEAGALVGATPSQGYVIRSVERGSSRVIVVHAADEANAVFGMYALLEELGVRYFHPMQELVPALPGPHLPAVVDISREPAFRVRGIQLHLLHPLEYFRPFNEPGDRNLEVALRVIDWLVKTGQNHVQWSILRTVDFEAWRPHAQAIIDYAHSRGVTVGAVVDVWGGASLQNAYDLISSEENWSEELETQLDKLMTIDWDIVEMGLGEFLSSEPGTVITWLNHATAYMADHHPHAKLSITNHVGNYPELWIDYEGEETFYYHLPGEADPRLVNNVHTVFFFDLFRDWGGYGHPDFHLQRDFLYEQLGQREMRYMPESAYWCTADIDVPVFLPEYIHARWVDIHELDREVRERGLPAVEGHVLFSSGHEWGYWMTDYLTAKMMWSPGAELDDFLADITRSFGSCTAEVHAPFAQYTALQTEFLFDLRLMGYLTGEDLHDDLGFLLDITTHPTRIAYHDVLDMNPEELDSFERDVLGGLAAFAAEVEPIESTFADVCTRSDAGLRPWCAELADGIRVTRLRALHALALYRGVVSHARGEDAAAHFAEAKRIRALAAEVIHRREESYRFDVEELTGAYANPTRYPFGYLRQAHTQCLWERQEQQAEIVVEIGGAPSFTAIPSCQD